MSLFCQTRGPDPHPRPLSACRSAAQDVHSRWVLRHLRSPSQCRLAAIEPAAAHRTAQTLRPKIIYDPVSGAAGAQGRLARPRPVAQPAASNGTAAWLAHDERRSAPLPGAFQEKLLRISPAQIDRLLGSARPPPRDPARSRRTPSPIATTRPKTIMSVPSRLRGFTAAGRKTLPSGTKAPTPCWRSCRNWKKSCRIRCRTSKPTTAANASTGRCTDT